MTPLPPTDIQIASKPPPIPRAAIKILYFASLRTIVSLDSEIVALPGGGLPLSLLPDVLLALHPALQEPLKTCAWSVNAEMIAEEELGELVLQGGEEVAAIPPVSGG